MSKKRIKWKVWKDQYGWMAWKNDYLYVRFGNWDDAMEEARRRALKDYLQ